MGTKETAIAQLISNDLGITVTAPSAGSNYYSFPAPNLEIGIKMVQAANGCGIKAIVGGIEDGQFITETWDVPNDKVVIGMAPAIFQAYSMAQSQVKALALLLPALLGKGPSSNVSAILPPPSNGVKPLQK